MARTIKTNDGTSLAYEQHGETGPILVLIHGWSGSRRYFSSVFEHLAGRCRVYALDLRHHGDSGRPSHGLHVARLAADLNDFLTELRLTDVCLLGASMGAAVIWSYIENYRTSRLSGAVFVDQAPLQNRAEGWDLGSKGCYDAASLAALQSSLVADLRAAAEGTADSCLSKPIDPELREALIGETMRCDPRALGQIMADHTQLDWRPVLPTIDLPCLNLVGRRSNVFPWEGCAAVGSLIPDCKTVFFEECNHWLYIEEPRKFADVVLRFVVPETRGSIAHESSA